MAEQDLLIQIPDDRLPQLAALYQEKAQWAPYMANFIHTAMKWKKSDKYKDVMTFLSPNNSWEEDGTIIVIAQLHCQDIFVFTLDDQCINLYKGLKASNLIFTAPRTLFYGVHEKHVPTVKKFLTERNREIENYISCYIYAMSPEEGKKLIIECPSDVYTKALEPHLVTQINNIWPHRFPNSEKYLSCYIDINGGYGVFLKSTNEMVAWVIRHGFGHLGMLQTEEGHKRKGYASLITKVLSKEIAEEGHWPMGTILVENKNSQLMFEKLGFNIIGKCVYIEVKLNNPLTNL